MISNKGALALICIYGEDSSDDEVPGPRVSTKRTHKDEDDDDNSTKRQERLPVPIEFTKPQTEEEYTDDPSMHEGRLRSFPHERGNWATYVYIPYVADTMGLEELLGEIMKTVSPKFDIKPSNDYHISLTKTVILKYHWIQPFVDSVKEKTAHVKRFVVMLDTIEIYCNEERTRTFIGLTVKTGFESLQKLVEMMDKCLEDYKLPTFYENPSFHMSIAWVAGDVEEELTSYISELNSIFNQLLSSYPQETWCIYVNDIFCKSGNKIFQLNLC